MTTVEARSPGRSFRPDIQGLRAIAVGAVVLYHAGVPFLPGGYVGVDIFFVISGFLITSHLLGGFEREGKVHFASFYARRARRILPASFLVLLLSTLAALIWIPPLQREETFKDAIATALYVPNYLFASQGTNYLSEATPSIFQHYWSLGVEEQFYLFWPALIALGFLVLKSRKAVAWMIGVVVIVSFVACVVLTFRSQPWAFFSLPTRAWELGVGGLVGFVLLKRRLPIPAGLAAVLGWVGVAGLVACVLVYSSATAFPGYAAAGPVVSTAFVILGGSVVGRWGPTAALSTRPMMFLGMISYSLYLVHWPALVLPQAAVGYFNPLPLWVTIAIAVVCVPVAWLLYRFVEDPARSWKWMASARPRRTLLSALGASAVAVAVALAGIGVTSGLPLHTSTVVDATALGDPPANTGFVPANITPSLWSVSDDNPAIYDDGCHLDFAETSGKGCAFGPDGAPTIALFGDSHAAQWFPALMAYASEHGYRLETYTKSSCPSVDVEIVRAGTPYTQCTQWRENVLKHLNEEPPELVILANYGIAKIADSGDYLGAWGSGLQATISAIPGASKVAIMADTPDLGQTPSICLSANVADTMPCSRSRSFALSAPTRVVEADVAAALEVPVIDLTGYICGPEICDPVVGDLVVYRDAHHLTATFSTALAPAIGAAIDPILNTG